MYKVRVDYTLTQSVKKFYERACRQNGIEPNYKEDGSVKTIGVGQNTIAFPINLTVNNAKTTYKKCLFGLVKKPITEFEKHIVTPGDVYKITDKSIYFYSKTADDAIQASCALKSEYGITNTISYIQLDD